MKKIYSIQVLRGLAAISVVFYHMLIIEKKYSGGDLWLPHFFKIGQSGVDLFFVISGFIMVTITRKNQAAGGQSTREFLLHRFARIYPNYWFYFFITVGVFLFQPSLVNSSQGNHVNFLTSFFLLPSNSFPLVLVAWSLIFEIWFYLVFSLLTRVSGTALIFSLLCWLSLLLMINVLFAPPANALASLLTSPYSIEFILGALGAMITAAGSVKKIPVKVFGAVIVAFAIAYPFLFFAVYSQDRHGLLVQAVVFGSLFSLLLIACVSIENKSSIRWPRFFIRLGDISYTIYLSHVLIMGLIGRIWASFFQRPDSFLDNLLVVPLILVAVIVYSRIGNRWIERPSYELFSRSRAKARNPQNTVASRKRV